MRALMTALVTVAVLFAAIRAWADPPAAHTARAEAKEAAEKPAAQAAPAPIPTRIAFEAVRVGSDTSTLVCVALVMTGPTNTVIPAGCLDAGTAKKAAAWTAKPAAAKGGK